MAQDVILSNTEGVPPNYVKYARLSELNFNAFDKYFDAVFCINEMPENRERFSPLRADLRGDYLATLRNAVR